MICTASTPRLASQWLLFSMKFMICARLFDMVMTGLILASLVSTGFASLTKSMHGRAAGLPVANSKSHGVELEPKPRAIRAQSSLNGEDHLLYAAIYSIKDGQTSTLVLNNTTHHDEIARVTLFNKEGRSHLIPEMTLPANSNKRIDLSQRITDDELDGFEEGSVEIFFHGASMGIGGQLAVYDYRHSLSFDVPFTEMMNFNSSQVESLWWGLDHKAQAEVYIANTESVQTVVTPSLYVGGHIYQLDAIGLEAHHQEIINIGKELKKLKMESAASAGAIVLQYSNGPGAIAVAGSIMNKDNGFSSTMRFSDSTMYRTDTLHGAYLPIGKPTSESGLSQGLIFTPHITIGNVADQSVRVRVTVRYRVGNNGDSVELAPVDLKEHEVRELDVSPILSAVGDRVLSDSGIEIKQNGPLGAVIGSVASVDQTGNQVFDVPLRDPKLLHMTAGGNHPWTIAGDNLAVLHLKNIDPDANDKPRQALVTIYFDGGKYRLPIQLIMPGQTLNVDIKKLRDKQVKDDLGNVIPRSVNTGQVEWFSLGGSGQFVGRIVQYDPEAKIASSFSCGTVCSCDPGLNQGASSITVLPNSGHPGDTFSIIVTEAFDICQGEAPSDVQTEFREVTDLPGTVITFADPSIASATGVYGNKAGTTQVSAFWDSTTNPACLQGDISGQCDDLSCPNNYAQGSAITNVTNKAIASVVLTPKEVSFTNDITIFKDTVGSTPQIVDPVWKDTNTAAQNDPVAYVRNTNMQATVKFAVSPVPTQAINGITIEGAVSGLGKFVKTGVSIAAGQSVLTVTDITIDTALPNTTKFYDPMTISWRHMTDGSSCPRCTNDGNTANKVYVTLATPLQTVYLTSLSFAVSQDGATDQATAFQKSWAQFTGPANIKTWDNRTLFYYRDGVNFSDCALDEVDLLTSTNGSGQCGSFAYLLKGVLAVNGINSTFVTAYANDGLDFLVKDWTYATPSFSPTDIFPWKLVLNPSAPGLDMVPKQPGNVYGDLTSLSTLKGQNTAPPSEKIFFKHFIIKVSLTGVTPSYYDPSYGGTYTDQDDFENKAVDGYVAPHVPGDASNAFRIKKSVGLHNIRFSE